MDEPTYRRTRGLCTDVPKQKQYSRLEKNWFPELLLCIGEVKLELPLGHFRAAFFLLWEEEKLGNQVFIK